MVPAAIGWLDLTTLIPSGSRAGPVAKAGVLLTTGTGWRLFGLIGSKDAPTLLEDFWAEVDKLLKEKGVI